MGSGLREPRGALGQNVFGLLFPDWRSAQANAIKTPCKAPQNDVSVALSDGRPVGFVAVGLIDEDAARAQFTAGGTSARRPVSPPDGRPGSLQGAPIALR